MKYDDIIHLPHHVSPTRPHMPIADRAAQFSPFAALAGYEAAIKETARLTDKRIELDENAKAELARRLQVISDLLGVRPEISITWFCQDEKKAGGSYLTSTGVVQKIDELGQRIVMEDSARIPLKEVVGIEGEIFV